MAYITSDDLKSTLDLTGETYADADITAAIAAASASVDDQCNRRFTLDADNTSVRRFTAVHHRLIDVDDVVDVAQLAVGPGNNTFPTVLTQDTDYLLEPLNAAADGRPYEAIHAIHHRFPRHRAAIQVTGQFGWPAVPFEVITATSLLASRFLRRMREAPFGIVTIGLDGQVARIAQTDPDIVRMLMPLTRILGA